MKTIAVFSVVLLVALFTVSEAKPFRRNRPGTRDSEDTGRPECPRRCPRPTRRNRVCASVGGLYNRTFLSECVVDKTACKTGRNITIISERPCPRTASQAAGKQEEDSESDSEEDNSIESTEGGEVDASTTSAPITTVTSQPPTSPRTTISATDTFSLGGAGTTSPTTDTDPTDPTTAAQTDPTTAAQTDPGTPTPSSQGASASSSGTSVAATTGRQCNRLDSCPLSSAVCGTDGQTYESQCVLEVTACVNGLDTLTVAHAGFCTL